MPNPHAVLVVDNEPTLRSTIASILRRAGYWVMEAATPLEAQSCLAQFPIDLLLFDLIRLDDNGLRLLHQTRRPGAQIPILILTAQASLEAALEAIRLGAHAYLLKPVDPDLILTRVQELLSENQPRKEILE